MKRCFALCLVPCLLALPGPHPAEAQIPGLRLGFAGGPSFPLGALDDDAGVGLHVRGSLGIEPPLTPIGIRGDLLWQQFPHEGDGSLTTLAGLINGTWRAPLPILQPYVIAGAGFLRFDEPGTPRNGDLDPGESGTRFAWVGGAGVQLRLIRFGAFVEARYLDWGRNRAIPLTFGILF
jgi:hypothetical protein